jgi:transposase
MKHPATSAYIARRTAEGLTPNEILRCLKRYTARQLFRLKQTTAPATT